MSTTDTSEQLYRVLKRGETIPFNALAKDPNTGLLARVATVGEAYRPESDHSIHIVPVPPEEEKPAATAQVDPYASLQKAWHDGYMITNGGSVEYFPYECPPEWAGNPENYHIGDWNLYSYLARNFPDYDVYTQSPHREDFTLEMLTGPNGERFRPLMLGEKAEPGDEYLGVRKLAWWKCTQTSSMGAPATWAHHRSSRPLPAKQPEPQKWPFDLQRALAGDPLVTRGGRKVVWTKPYKRDVWHCEGEIEGDCIEKHWDAHGRYFAGPPEHAFDLFLATPPPAKDVVPEGFREISDEEKNGQWIEEAKYWSKKDDCWQKYRGTAPGETGEGCCAVKVDRIIAPIASPPEQEPAPQDSSAVGAPTEEWIPLGPEDVLRDDIFRDTKGEGTYRWMYLGNRGLHMQVEGKFIVSWHQLFTYWEISRNGGKTWEPCKKRKASQDYNCPPVKGVDVAAEMDAARLLDENARLVSSMDLGLRLLNSIRWDYDRRIIRLKEQHAAEVKRLKQELEDARRELTESEATENAQFAELHALQQEHKQLQNRAESAERRAEEWQSRLAKEVEGFRSLRDADERCIGNLNKQTEQLRSRPAELPWVPVSVECGPHDPVIYADCTAVLGMDEFRYRSSLATHYIHANVFPLPKPLPVEDAFEKWWTDRLYNTACHKTALKEAMRDAWQAAQQGGAKV